MVKIHLVASAALVLCAGVCSALDLYSDINYQGTLCRFATPAGNCFSIPEPCYRSVKSATIHQGWLCQLHSEDGCEGIWKDIKQDTTALPDSDWKSVACWTAHARGGSYTARDASSSIGNPYQTGSAGEPEMKPRD
ncbi:hypothetical protein B0O80DRAFT_430740 [Mortierella sp. GBAus27b]|nr:hypothetical protein B0O80DRAFT_430740 [Mortierella sp. GBAus27b]